MKPDTIGNLKLKKGADILKISVSITQRQGPLAMVRAEVV
jgi:hypothetical protein